MGGKQPHVTAYTKGPADTRWLTCASEVIEKCEVNSGCYGYSPLVYCSYTALSS